MAFQELADLDCSVAYPLGGKDKKTNKANPTSVEGYFIGSRQVASTKSKTGFASLHIFQTKKGNVGIWGKTNLDSKMATVTPGAMTRVTFTGMVETKNQPMYKYRVEVDNDNTIDVAGASNDDNAQGDVGDNEDSSYDSQDTDGPEETDAGEDDVPMDATPPARPQAPRQAPTVDSDRRAKVQALLNRGGSKRTA